MDSMLFFVVTSRNSFVILLGMITYNRNELVQIGRAISNWLYHGLGNNVCVWSPFKHFKRASTCCGCRAGRLKQRSMSVLVNHRLPAASTGILTKENWGM